MGKHGPCCHCGVTSTPLWRNGPPEKPVLCNACGSRWRTKGSLTNYTPLHARPEHDELEAGFSKSKAISTKNKGAKVLKRKFTNDVGELVVAPLDYSLGFHKVFDEETSNRSSSGSAISNSESCAQYGSADASDLTGPSQPLSMWDSTVPSRKRTCVSRPKPSPVEKLTKDLYTIWHQQLASCISSCSEEDLLLECDKPMVSVEIGHGSVLIRHPSSITREEESEASSLSFDNKLLNSRQVKWSPDFIEDPGTNSLSKGIEKLKNPANQGAVWRTTRENDQVDKLQILASHDSPLPRIDLQDVLNFEKFSSQLTPAEQQKLLNLLPPVDTLEIPYSLKSMFNSAEFTENLLSFQKLLGDGVFDGSLFGVNSEDCRNLKRLILCDQKKSTWVQKYKDLKDSKGKSSTQSKVLGGFSGSATVRPAIMNRSRDGQPKKFSGPRIRVKSPRRSIVKSIAEDFELIDKESSFFSSTRSLNLMRNGDLDSFFHFDGESSEQDLLVDVPSNGSFPEAELLLPTPGAAGLASSSSTVYHTGFV